MNASTSKGAMFTKIAVSGESKRFKRGGYPLYCLQPENQKSEFVCKFVVILVTETRV